MQFLSLPLPPFKDYELIDCGDGYKLERFGEYTLSRPEPQAIWRKSLKIEEWNSKWHAHFQRASSKDGKSNKEDSGNWTTKENMPHNWKIAYHYKDMHLQFKMALTAFKHVGIFPEQASNWNYLYDHRALLKDQKMMNLFAYTGGASLAAKYAGSDIVHLDAVKKVVDWASENMKLSNLQDIRWVVEDAITFAAKEVKREKKYNALMLDPPAFGRGPDGEKWQLEDQLDELLYLCTKLLAPKNSLFIINLYSMGYSPIVLETMIKSHFKQLKDYEFGDLYIQDSFGKKLPTGIFLRFTL